MREIHVVHGDHLVAVERRVVARVAAHKHIVLRLAEPEIRAHYARLRVIRLEEREFRSGNVYDKPKILFFLNELCLTPMNDI